MRPEYSVCQQCAKDNAQELGFSPCFVSGARCIVELPPLIKDPGEIASEPFVAAGFDPDFKGRRGKVFSQALV